MIKFRKILEKAAGQSGVGQLRSPLLIGIGGEPQQRSAEPPAQEASIAVDELLASTAVLEPAQAETPARATAASAVPGVAEEAPAVLETATPEQSAGSAEPAVEPHGENVISDSLIESVLNEIQTDGDAAATGETSDAAPDALGAAEEKPPAEARKRETVSPYKPEEQGPATEVIIEGMINDAFTSIEQADQEKKAALAKSQQDAFVDVGPDGSSGTGAIDDSFISEVDRLLNAFGNAGDLLGTDDSGKSAEKVLEEVSEIAASGAEPAEGTLPDDASELAQAKSPAGDVEFDVSFADDHAGTEEDGPAGQILGKAFDMFSAPARRKAAKPASRDAGDAGGADKSAESLEGVFDESSDAQLASAEDVAEIVSREEKEALFAEGAKDSANDELAQIEKDLNDIASIETSKPAPGEPVEVTLDFAAAIAPAGDAADEASQEKTEDLLSKVLADLERLGPVDKPEKEAPQEEKAPGKPEAEDFSEILSEINSDQAREAEASAAAVAADDPKAVEVAAASRSEEELLDEAMQAGDETAETTSAEGAADASAEEPDSAEAASAGGKARVIIARRGPDAAKPAGPASADEEIIEDALADDDEHEEAGAAEAAQTVATEAPVAEPTAKEAKPSEETVEDETTLLANLEASMETAVQKAEEAAKNTAVKEAKAAPDSPAASAKSSGPANAAASAESEEERVRKQVLDRSKEVEQKILDDVFGEKKNYKAEVKAELANMGDADREAERRDKRARDAMLSADPSGAFSGTLEGGPSAERVFDGRLGVFWLAWQLNRPFVKWMSPSTLKLVGALALVLLGTSFAWLAAAIYHILRGS